VLFFALLPPHPEAPTIEPMDVGIVMREGLPENFMMVVHQIAHRQQYFKFAVET
jgi:hypothetical protein